MFGVFGRVFCKGLLKFGVVFVFKFGTRVFSCFRDVRSMVELNSVMLCGIELVSCLKRNLRVLFMV